MKVEIANRKKEILQSLEAEERELINKIDAEIMIEKGLDKLMIHVFVVVEDLKPNCYLLFFK